MRVARRFSAILIAGIIGATALGAAAVVMARQERPVQSGVDVLARMRDLHSGEHGCALIETIASFRSGRVDRWYETACPPGVRRIDLLPGDSLNGLLFRRDSLYEMKAGQVDTAQAFAHALSMLMYDAVAAPPTETAARLEMVGFDLTSVRTSTWQDRPAYVVGGLGEDDRNSTQFWIDVERLVPVRVIESYPLKGAKPGDPALVREVWLDGYARHGEYWLPGELSFFRNGERFLVEKMTVLDTGITVDSMAFLPAPWLPPSWITDPPALTSQH